MKIGPKYKIARRLGAPIFEKTQTQKFAMREQRKQASFRGRRRRNRSDYGDQMREKQKARFTYGVTERQFRNYVRAATAQRHIDPTQALYENLERRLDNAVYRAGFASTRSAGRQMVSHGHVVVNGKKMTIPSYRTKENDEIRVRERSKENGLFVDIHERLGERGSVSWLNVDGKDMNITISGSPQLEGADVLFDIQAIIEFYSR